ncbi:hypothetical protein H696_02473 [Fonticula alba]|uniref:Uncharacterized protein n=1 Tax=Fonticula alba TaxID=691883 RepID=A0A058ZC77_FONAL|nr:hypothetical protein H696_02473 [Fonticula alba]KCV71538.1 hypothetical protein H696_02473 [Fonticula alba]|eukprot:XP_009494661.1 hypothetical protein H696_02473 [Fonticula alba]
MDDQGVDADIHAAIAGSEGLNRDAYAIDAHTQGSLWIVKELHDLSVELDQETLKDSETLRFWYVILGDR